VRQPRQSRHQRKQGDEQENVPLFFGSIGSQTWGIRASLEEKTEWDGALRQEGVSLDIDALVGTARMKTELKEYLSNTRHRADV